MEYWCKLILHIFFAKQLLNMMDSIFHISTDNSKLDIEVIHSFLINQSYWAKNRSLETVKKSIENSLCFGLYFGNKQIGFGRVATDFAVFAWILDVFIIDEYRGKGLSKEIINSILKHEGLQNIQRWGLATKDAHGLYEQFGFHKCLTPEIFMEKINE